MQLRPLLSALAAAALATLLFRDSTPIFFWTSQDGADSKVVADLVVTDAVIYTSNSSFPFAEAMAVRKGRVLHIGNFSSVQDLIGQNTRQLNLNGKVVVPGFIDSHVHLIFGGLQMVQVELHDVKSKDEFVSKVKEAATGKEKDSWVLGGGWNNEIWGGDLPIASWIDDVTPNNPVWLSRMDGHMGLANSLALKKAGITNCTENPVGGSVVRTTDGEPTGLLVDSAMKLLLPWIPEVSISDRREAVLRASKLALKRGVTTVVDFGRYFPGTPVDHVWEDFSDVYQWFDSSGKMLVRVCLFFPMETLTHLLSIFKRRGRAFGQWIYLGGVKAFADGSLGSNSALLNEPYAGEPNNYGLQVTDMNWLLNRSIEADKAGFQVAVHAIGDKANDLILDLNVALASTNGIRDRRFRIEHAQHLSPGATFRFGEQRVIASVQPDHLLDDADSAAKKLGVDRAQSGSYLFKSLFTSNACVAFGSDWPVVDINPLRAIKTAMKRVPPGWQNAWNPSECVTVNDALNAYTILAAYSCFLDDEVGSLSPGKLADFVVLSTNSWAEFAEEATASVEATYVSGMQAYP